MAGILQKVLYFLERLFCIWVSVILLGSKWQYIIIGSWLNRRHAILWIDRKWQDYVYIQCEYKSTKQKIKHLLREENKVKENKIS